VGAVATSGWEKGAEPVQVGAGAGAGAGASARLFVARSSQLHNHGRGSKGGGCHLPGPMMRTMGLLESLWLDASPAMFCSARRT